MNLHINCIRCSLLFAFTFLLIFAAEAFADVTIDITAPENDTISQTRPELNFTTSGPSNVTYSWDGEGNISGCRNCTSFNTTYGENDGSDANLVALWHFNENFAATLYDETYNNNNGTRGNGSGTRPNWTAGKFGPALDFDGTNDFVNVSDSSSLDITGGLTMAAWVYPEFTSWPSDYVGVIGKNYTYALGVGSGKLRITLYNSTGDYSNTNSPDNIPRNQWIHIAGTFNGSWTTVYINGIEVNSQAVSTDWGSAITTTDYSLQVGYYSGYIYFDGTIDEVAIYNRSLSGTEIQELYNKSLSEGPHNVTVYATDMLGNQNSTTTNFTVVPPVKNVDTGKYFWTIQETIDDSSTDTGHTITVDAGIYTENVDVNKSLTIIGAGYASTTVNASNPNDHVFHITVDSVNISGFSITGSGSGSIGIYLDGVSNGNISDNVISQNSQGSQGIYIQNSSNAAVTGNKVTSSTRYGITLLNSNGSTIERNIVKTNSKGGIFLNTSSDNNVTNNTANSNEYGIYLWGSDTNNVADNNASSNTKDGIALYLSSSYNNVTDNTANSNTWGGITLNLSNYNNVTNNTANSNIDYDGIYLYNSTGNVIANNIANLNNNTGITLDGSDSNRVINNTASSNKWDAIYLYNSTNNAIVNNTATSNSINGLLLSFSSNNTITNNTASSNNYNGIYFWYSDNNTLTNNTFYNNRWDFYSEDSSSNTITSNLFNDTTASFTYSGNISVNSSSPPAGGTPRNLTGIGKYLNVTNTSAAWIFLNISYADVNLGETIEDTLSIYRHTGIGWKSVSGGGMNNVTKYVYANIIEFGVFAPLGNDNTTPRIYYTTDTTESGNRSQNWIFVNVSVNESNLHTLILELKGEVYDNYTDWDGDEGVNHWRNITVLPQGTYKIKVYASDAAGHVNVTDSITIELDTTPPTYSNLTPLNNSYTSDTGQNISIVITDEGSDVNAGSLSMNVSGNYYDTNSGKLDYDTNSGLLTYYADDGEFNGGQVVYVVVNAEDNVGNQMGGVTWSFTVGLPPQITITSPPEGLITDTIPNLNLTSDETANVTYNWDGEGNISGCRECNVFNTTYGESVPEANTSLLLHFNENFGDTAFDDSGNSNDGTRGNATAGTKPTWTTGRFGPALDFDGVDDEMEVPYSSSLNITKELTVMVWFKLNGPNAGPTNQYLVSQGTSGGTNYRWSVVFMRGTSGTTPNSTFAWVCTENGSCGTASSRILTPSNTIQFNKWYFAVLTYNSSDSKMRLYINGSLLNETTHGTGGEIRNSDTDPVQIGEWFQRNSNHPNGTIDEVHILDRVLNASEVADYYNKSLVDGQHNVTVYVNDSNGTLNSTTRYFTVDTTPPIIAIILPENTTYNTASINLSVSNVSADAIDTWWYNLNDAINTTFTPNITITGTIDSNKLIVYANSSIDGNIGSSILYFTVDTTSSVITIDSPSNDTLTDNTPELNFTTNENANISYSWDGEGNISGCRSCNSYNTIYGESKKDANTFGLWRFNENDCSNITDDSGNGNFGTISGATWTQGKFGGALYFNGINASVKVPDNDNLDFNVNDSFTIGLWTKTGATSPGYIIRKHSGGFTPGWYILLYRGKLYFIMRPLLEDSSLFLRSTAEVNDDNWHHIAIVQNGTDNNATLYVDGVVKDSRINYLTSLSNNSLDMYLGGMTSDFFNGTIDDLHILYRALNATEIAAEYNRYLVDGSHYVTVYANDSVGNLNSTTRAFMVESTPPTISNPQFNETQIAPNGVVQFNVTVTDNTGVDTVIATFRYPNATEINRTLSNISDMYYYEWTDTSAEGNYSVTYIWANDTSGNVNAAIHTDVSFIAEDSTAPTWIEIPSDQQAEANTSFTYNVNASDNAIDTYFINDTMNFAINATSGVITNNTVLNFGTYDLNISVNDTSGNVLSAVITITVADTIAPVITLVSPSPAESGTLSSSTSYVTINISTVEFNPADLGLYWDDENDDENDLNRSFYSNYGQYESITKLVSAGNTYTYYVWANDTSGNANQTETRTFSVDSGGSDSPTSPNGVGTTTTTLPTVTTNKGTAVITFSYIDVGSPATFDVPETEDVYLTRVFLAVKKKVTNVKLTIRTLDTRPATIEKDVTGITYKYMEIVHENANDEDVSIAILTFKVGKSWIDDNSIDPDSITLNRYSEDAWTILTTTKLSCDSGYCYYEAGSPGLSVFGISGSIVTTTATTMETTTTIASSTHTSTDAGLTSGSSMTPSPIDRPLTELLLGKQGKPISKTAIVLVVILIILIAAYMYYRHRKGEGKWWEDQIKSTEGQTEWAILRESPKE